MFMNIDDVQNDLTAAAAVVAQFFADANLV
jgi:hypothetical protein